MRGRSTMSVTRRKLFAAVVTTLVVGLGFFVLGGRPAKADLPLTQTSVSTAGDWKDFHYQEAKECKKCHTRPTGEYRPSLDLVMLTEYSIWKTHDKHAQAYAVLKGERGRKISELLTGDK